MLDRRQDRVRLGLGIVVCLCLAFAAGFAVYSLRSKLDAARFPGPPEARILWEAWRRVESHFYGDVPSAKVRTYGAIERSLTLLDPYTVFVEPVSRELEQDQLRGAYGGIGVTLWRTPDGWLALAPYPGSPAERAGLVRGDVILAVDGEAVSEATPPSELEAELHGEVGTRVRLKIKRSSESAFETTIERERIEVPSVTWHVEPGRIGYVHIARFTERTDDELGEALRSFDGAERGLVLDLRENRGGLLESAVAVAGRFLAAGDVVLRQTGRGGERSFTARSDGDLMTPLIVLVDGGTASAAEMVAGALQDHDRARLVGQPTFGKGSVQEIYHLSDGSSLHVTTAVWLTPEGNRIDGDGLAPDTVVSDDTNQEDAALQQALSYLESE